jgi:hypothetical protein
MPNRKTKALVAKPRRNIQKAAGIKQEIQHSVASMKEAQQLLDFAKNGGKAAGWGLLGNASGLIVGVILHASQMATFASIGMMLGVGLYAIRCFQNMRTPHLEQLDAELRDLEAMRVAGRITDDDYPNMRAAILKTHGF